MWKDLAKIRDTLQLLTTPIRFTLVEAQFRWSAQWPLKPAHKTVVSLWTNTTFGSRNRLTVTKRTRIIVFIYYFYTKHTNIHALFIIDDYHLLGCCGSDLYIHHYQSCILLIRIFRLILHSLLITLDRSAQNTMHTHKVTHTNISRNKERCQYENINHQWKSGANFKVSTWIWDSLG